MVCGPTNCELCRGKPSMASGVANRPRRLRAFMRVLGVLYNAVRRPGALQLRKFTEYVLTPGDRHLHTEYPQTSRTHTSITTRPPWGYTTAQLDRRSESARNRHVRHPARSCGRSVGEPPGGGHDALGGRQQLLGQRLRLRAHQRGVGRRGRPAGRQLVWALRCGLDAAPPRPVPAGGKLANSPNSPQLPRGRRVHANTAGQCNQSVDCATRACTIHPDPARVDRRDS